VLQSHGLNQEQLQELGVKQAQGGGELKKVAASNEKEYEVFEHEKHLVHARLTISQYDRVTGANQSQEQVQKFTPQEFDRMTKEQAFAGHKVMVLHDPAKKGQPKAKDTEPLQHLKPQIVGGAGSGLPLDKPLEDLSLEDLQTAYREFKGADVTVPTDKTELVDEIKRHHAWLRDEAKQEELKGQSDRRLEAAGADVETGAALNQEPLAR